MLVSPLLHFFSTAIVLYLHIFVKEAKKQFFPSSVLDKSVFLCYNLFGTKGGDFYDWAVIEKTSGKMIGTCGFTNIFPKEKTAEVGYVIAQDFWGKGIAKEALCEVLRFGFETFDFERIYARHMLGNDASGKVMQKCGMTFENIYKNSEYIKGEYKTILVYGITKQNFEKTKETK